MNQINAKRITAFLACLVLTGCMTRVHFEDGGITTNARLTAEYSIAADGAKTWKVDTMRQSLLDRVKTSLSNMVNYLTRSLDNAAPKVGE